MTTLTSPNPSVGPTSTYAIIALVSGILGWTLFPMLGSLVAVIFGHMARAEIKRGQNMEGDGMALAGLILGYSGFIITVLAIMFVVLLLFGVIGVLALQELNTAALL